MAKAAIEASETAAAHAACRNCDAALQGPYCHVCGQSAHDHKKSIWRLTHEAVEGLFHLDGRLMRTAPDLFFRPGRLARDYLQGRLVRRTPPFRTFLAALVVFLTAAEFGVHQSQAAHEREAEARAERMKTPQGRAVEADRIRRDAAAGRTEDLQEAAEERDEELKDADVPRARTEQRYQDDVAAAQARYAQALAHADRTAQGLPEPPKPPRKRPDSWLRAGVRRATDNPEYYWSVLFAWGHRAAVLLLPIVGLALGLVYRRRRDLVLYDHLLVAMQLMAFSFLANAPGLLLPSPYILWWLGAVALWTPVNLFQTLRGGYGSGAPGAVAKTLIVWTISATSFALLLAGLFVFSLAQLK